VTFPAESVRRAVGSEPMIDDAEPREGARADAGL